MKVKEYRFMEECVERGTDLGIARAHKHTDTPSATKIVEEVVAAVMTEIAEGWDFDQDTP